MRPNRLSFVLACLFALLLGLALAGCGSSSGSGGPAPTNAANARTDLTLQGQADQALITSGYTGTITPTDSTNANTVGDATGTALQNAINDAATQSGAGVSVPAPPASVGPASAVPLSAIVESAKAFAVSIGQARARPLATTVVTIAESLTTPTCASGGVTVNGQITVADNGIDTFTVSVDNLTIAFTQCVINGYELSGSIVVNEDSSTIFSQPNPNAIATITNFDVYQDGGLAINEIASGTFYNPIFRYSVLGSTALTFDFNTGVDTASGTLTYSRTVGGVTCTATTTYTDPLVTPLPVFTCP